MWLKYNITNPANFDLTIMFWRKFLDIGAGYQEWEADYT